MAVGAKKFIDPDQLKQDVSFTESELDSAMMTQAALFAHYGVLNADALHQVDKFKLVIEVKEARVAQQIRDEAAEAGAKTTEKGIEQQLSLSPEIIELKKALNEAKTQSEIARTTLEALRQKRDMLIQIGVARRGEREGELRIRTVEEAITAKDRILKDRANIVIKQV